MFLRCCRRVIPASAVGRQEGLTAMGDSTISFMGGGKTSRRTGFSIVRMSRSVGNAPWLPSPLGPPETLWSLDEGAWPLMEGAQEALVASRLPCAPQLPFAADITWAFEVGHGLR